MDSSNARESSLEGLNEYDRGAWDPKSKIQQHQDWEQINRELRHHGFPSIIIEEPNERNNILGSPVVVLSSDMARSIQDMLTTLMSDCDRRQELIQELIATNNQLKEDSQYQMTISDRLELRARDLKLMVENAKSKIQELEDSCCSDRSFFQEQEEKLTNTKSVIHSRCKQLESKCHLQNGEVARLQEKLSKLHQEEEARVKRQTEVFNQFRRRTVRGHNCSDDRLLDVIDSYEAQIYKMKKQLDVFGVGKESGPATNDSIDATPNYKSLIKAYEKQLRETKKKLKEVSDNSEILKLDLESRPSIKDFRAGQLRVKKLEKLLRHHNISLPGEKVPAVIYIDETKYSTKADDVDYLPLDLCKKYLRTVCSDLGVFDLAHIQSRVQKQLQAVEAFPRLEQFAKDVLETIDDPKLSHSRETETLHRKAGKHSHAVWCERTWNHVLPTLQHWSQELSRLKELAQSVNKLSNKVAPFTVDKLTAPITVVKIIDSIDLLTSGSPNTSDQNGVELRPSETVVRNIVQHFQNLFDVPSVNGVYPRMNDIYTKLGEVHNVLKTLRDILGLGTSCKSSAIIECVSQLSTAHNSATYRQLAQLLEEEHLDSVAKRLAEHEEFFPVFQEITSNLMTILGIRRMEQVIPAVQALKMLNEN